MNNFGYNIWLHRFAKVVAAATFALIFIGGLVTTTGSGLAVPDWPTTYGHFMFSFPFSKMVGGILYEHGHRMAATVVGMLTVILAVWLWLKEPRRWMKWLGLVALLAVIAQGVLGGLTVLYLLPTPISVLHGCLAQTFFCITISIAMFTSKEWLLENEKITDTSKPSIQSLTLLTTGLVFAQLVIGAIMRHIGAGLAIPDFPLAFGKIIPPIETQAVAVHFLHRVGALIVSISILWLAAQIFRHHKNKPKLTRTTAILVLALIVQITFAALTIWTKKAMLPTTAHVATGAFILGTSLVLTLRAHRMFLSKESEMREGFFVEQPSAT